MNTTDAGWWTRARQARDQLVALLSDNSMVSLVDIGQDPLGASQQPVLRVHVRGDASNLEIPPMINEIPVRVLRGDYRLQ